MNKILVIGATGNVGSEIIKRLSQHPISIIGATRNPELQQTSSNLTWRQFEAMKNQDLSKLFQEVNRVFLMSAPGYANQDQVLAPLIKTAQHAKVEKVVLMTAIGVDASDDIPFRKAELQLEQSGLNYEIIRPNWFNQNFHTFWVAGIKTENKIFVPAGMGKTSFIDVQDIAACAASLLLREQSKNRTYVLTGPESLSYQDVAEIISAVSEQDISYEDTAPQVFKQGLLEAQMPDDYAELLVSLFEFVKLGYVGGITNDVEEIIGRPPLAFISYAESFKNCWKAH